MCDCTLPENYRIIPVVARTANGHPIMAFAGGEGPIICAYLWNRKGVDVDIHGVIAINPTCRRCSDAMAVTP